MKKIAISMLDHRRTTDHYPGVYDLLNETTRQVENEELFTDLLEEAFLAGLITGSIVVETVFSWPGLGLLAVQAVSNSDYPILQGVILLATVVYVSASLLVDVLYVVVDPRIRIR